MIKTLFAFLFLLIGLCFSRPMESLTNYNVIMVHGAADGVTNGFECGGNAAKNKPYDFYNKYKKAKDTEDSEEKDTTEADWQIGGAPGMIGYYGNSKKLTHWLDTKIFEDAVSNGSDYIYIQRSFTKPAGSPKDNGREIGYSNWRCGERRSLIEEAQEVKAKGRDNLSNWRKNAENRDKLPPSRNILIAHSMGGLASREYVQGADYNNDVDKVITLDSPHEGTGSLNLLLDMKNWPNRIFEGAMNAVLLSALWLGISSDLPNIEAALYGLGTSAGIAAVNFGGGTGILAGLNGFDYKQTDLLVDYIDTNSIYSYVNGVKRLQELPYRESLPMMRLLGGKNSMTFTDPNEGLRQQFRFLIPNALIASFGNVAVHASGNETNIANYVNSVTGFAVGLLAGVTVQEHGTALVPASSSLATSTRALDASKADVLKVRYDAAINANKDDRLASLSTDLTILASSILAVDIAIGYFFPAQAKVVKIAMGVIGADLLAVGIASTVLAGKADFELSHEAPILSEHQSDWHGAPNTYTQLPSGRPETITPYQMEEFLYEKPFANIRVFSSYSPDWEDLKEDALGLHAGSSLDSAMPISVASDKLSKPLAFKSSADWETFGAKKVRWDNSVQGVDGKVPIRHVDRYPMSGFVASDFIRRYEFEIDDLMPHRLRQIRLNFNFNQEIAWECNVDKAEGASDACTVYKRTPASPNWAERGKEKHPVSKDGIFVFEPEKYYTTGLGTIQKDNSFRKFLDFGKISKNTLDKIPIYF